MARRRPKPKVVRAGKGSIQATHTLRDEHAQLFNRVAEETLYGDRELFDGLLEPERALVIEWLAEAIVDGQADTSLHGLLWEVDYVRQPPTIEEFIENDYYFGRAASFLHSRWKDDLKEVFRPGSPVFEWILCLAGDTRVPLLDGTEATLKELHENWDGEPFWVYSIDQETGQVRPGECTKVTKFAEDDLFEVELDDGSTVRANADHEFVMRDGTKRRLRDLCEGDRLMPFNVSHRKPSKGSGEYEQVYIPGVQKYAYTHRISGAYVAGGQCPVVIDGDRAVAHHRNFKRFDNRPENIEWLGWQAHREVHRKAVANRSEEWRRNVSERQRRVAKDPTSPLRKGHLVFMHSAKGRALSRRNLSQAVISTEERARRGRQGCAVRWANPEEHVRAASRCRRRSQGNTWGRLTVLDDVTVDAVYTAYADCESLSETYVRLSVSRNRVVRLLRDAGLTILDLKKGYRNHRVASVRPAGREHVYCLTVPEWGNFAVSTGDGRSGIFSGNTGAIGVGKTTVADVALGYKLCVLSCLRDASRYYGLLPDEKIVFGIYSKTLTQAADAGFYKLRGYLDNSTYFTEHCPRDMKRQSRIDFEPVARKKIQVAQGSRSGHALGLDLFAFLMDEANFMDEKQDKDSGKTVGQAYDLYNATYTRLQSRFGRPGGVLPGMLFLVSSRNAQTSFLEEHLKTVMGGEHSQHTYVSDYALWECKPKSRYTFPGFRVEIGDRHAASRILEAEEKVRKGARIIEIPLELRKSFDEDTDQALRDMAGIATFNASPLIRDRASVHDAVHAKMSHPFSRVEVICDINDDILIEEHLQVSKLARIVGSKHVPRLNPKCPRFIHVDIGLVNDALGIAMGHVGGTMKTERTNAEGLYSTVSNPYILMDFMLRVRAPAGGEVDLSKLRAFILFLKRLYPIAKITFDQFQSSDSIQILKKHHLDVGHQSVDRKEDAYLSLRSAHFDRRISMYEYAPYIDEVLDLERLVKPNGRNKVDHPKKATKGGRGCFAGDTKVSLLNGREVTLRELARDYANEDIYVYTMAEGKVSVGCAVRPRLTRRRARTVIVVLDNGQEVCCTPDHRWMLRDGVYREAGDLRPEDSLMPLYRKVANRAGMRGYESYWCPSSEKWHFTHRMVGCWKYPGRYTGNQFGEGVMHHEGGKLNNDPRALRLMTAEDHSRMHALALCARRADPVFEEKRRERAVAYARSPEGRAFSRKKMAELNRDPAFALARNARAKILGQRTGSVNITKYNKSAKHRSVASEIGKRTIWIAIEASRGLRPQSTGALNPNARKDITLQRVRRTYRAGMSQRELCRQLSCTQKVVYRVLRETGLSWKVFVEARGRNHKVASVRPGPCVDVYDISVPGTENFALTAGVFVHNSKDIADAVAGVVWLCMNDERAMHESVADLEMAPRIVGQAVRAANDPVPTDAKKERIGSARKTWADLRSNV